MGLASPGLLPQELGIDLERDLSLSPSSEPGQLRSRYPRAAAACALGDPSPWLPISSIRRSLCLRLSAHFSCIPDTQPQGKGTLLGLRVESLLNMHEVSSGLSPSDTQEKGGRQPVCRRVVIIREGLLSVAGALRSPQPHARIFCTVSTSFSPGLRILFQFLAGAWHC